MLKKHGSLISVFVLLLLVACATKPESDVDTPEYHFKAGMRAIDNSDYQQAIKSFQRSVKIRRPKIMLPSVPAGDPKIQKHFL